MTFQTTTWRFSPLNVIFLRIQVSTSKEFMIVFQNERDENKRLQWNLDLTKGQGTNKISEAPNDGFLLNSLKTLFNSVPRVLLDL